MPNSLLATNTTHAIFLTAPPFHPVQRHHQHRPEAATSARQAAFCRSLMLRRCVAINYRTAWHGHKSHRWCWDTATNCR